MTKEILLEYWRGTICPTVVYSMTQLMIAPSDFEMELMPYVEVCFSALIEKKSTLLVNSIFLYIDNTGHTNYSFDF